MSIANCAIGPLYDEQIKKTLMYADHKFKRLMNTRMSLLEHLSPHYDGNDSNLLIVFYVQIMPDDFVMQLHRF
ncbi:hypothetical protein ESCOMM109M1_10110 [Escherichia coli]